MVDTNKYWMFHYEECSNVSYNDASQWMYRLSEYIEKHGKFEDEHFSMEQFEEYLFNGSDNAFCLTEDVSESTALWIAGFFERCNMEDNNEIEVNGE